LSRYHRLALGLFINRPTCTLYRRRIRQALNAQDEDGRELDEIRRL